MAGGAAVAGEPRRRGRPKGSGNKRARDLKGFIDARYGASAAQQSAAMCMVTPAELKAAGGSMAKARVNKALELVQHVRRAQEGRDDWLRQLVREELRGLADELPDQLAKAMERSIKRIGEAAAGFGLKDALKMIGDELADLLPYTDQRQPLAMEVKGAGFAPSVVVQMDGAAQLMPRDATDAEFIEVFEPGTALVAPMKSHDMQQVLDLAEKLDARAAD